MGVKNYISDMKLAPAVVCQKVLSFWFRGGLPLDKGLMKLWFMSSPADDLEIKNEFESIVQAIGSNEDGLRDVLQESPHGSLAATIVLDQFPRNIYRNTPGMFQYDSVALGIAKKVVELGFDKDEGLGKEFGSSARAFFYLPFEHSEDIKDQQSSVQLFTGLHQDHASDNLTKSFLDYAVSHHDIIEQFGRFPHRNHILGRQSTPAETAYLSGGGQTFGVTKQDDSASKNN